MYTLLWKILSWLVGESTSLKHRHWRYSLMKRVFNVKPSISNTHSRMQIPLPWRVQRLPAAHLETAIWSRLEGVLSQSENHRWGLLHNTCNLCKRPVRWWWDGMIMISAFLSFSLSEEKHFSYRAFRKAKWWSLGDTSLQRVSIQRDYTEKP